MKEKILALLKSYYPNGLYEDELYNMIVPRMGEIYCDFGHFPEAFLSLHQEKKISVTEVQDVLLIKYVMRSR